MPITDVVFKEKWATALESGTYRRGKSRLRKKTQLGDQFCCLGVCLDLIDDTKWVEDFLNNNLVSRYSWGDQGSFSMLPETVKASLGLIGREENDLMDMNDSGNK